MCCPSRQYSPDQFSSCILHCFASTALILSSHCLSALLRRMTDYTQIKWTRDMYVVSGTSQTILCLQFWRYLFVCSFFSLLAFFAVLFVLLFLLCLFSHLVVSCLFYVNFLLVCLFYRLISFLYCFVCDLVSSLHVNSPRC